jgi:DNA-binding CsgD family transcriptional regulator
MSKSSRLRLRDIRQVHNLIGYIRDAGDSPEIWQRIALEGLLKILGGNIGFTVDIRIAPEGFPQLIDPIDTGWQTQSVRRRFQEYAVSGEMARDPGTMKLLEAQKKKRFITCTRAELVDDAMWYSSPCVSEARRMGDVDDFVICTSGVKRDNIYGFIVYRPWSDRRFQARQCRIMQYFRLELLRAIRDCQSPPPPHPYIHQLSPRLRQPFELMLTSLSLKEIARKLQLSRHTVNGYQKEIYRLLNVKSRPELMCLFRPSKRPIRLPANL